MINDLWYKNAIIYCLSVATYMDANGDGVGDFAGLMRRLDYLQRTRRHGDLADAVPNLALSRRRLRHFQLLRGRSALRHARATSSNSRMRPSSAASGSSSTWS